MLSDCGICGLVTGTNAEIFISLGVGAIYSLKSSGGFTRVISYVIRRLEFEMSKFVGFI